jgi:hypothetical protein
VGSVWNCRNKLVLNGKVFNTFLHNVHEMLDLISHLKCMWHANVKEMKRALRWLLPTASLAEISLFVESVKESCLNRKVGLIH